MKLRFVFSLTVGLAVFGFGAASSRAADGTLSADRLNSLDQAGYFTPGFKSAVHDYVESKHALDQANAEQVKFKHDLPGLEKQTADAEAKVAVLREELTKYDHPEENDFARLQKKMTDPASKPEDQIVFAQAYVWTFPASPHAAEAEHYLQQLQRKLMDAQQAVKTAVVEHAAAYAKTLERAQAHDLNLGEWRNFLRNMSQDDLVKIIGHPTTTNNSGDWIYQGNYVVLPESEKKVGLQVIFDAGRVLNVDEKPAQP